MDSYASSSALSPSHFRLVQAVESATSATALNNILLTQLSKIQLRWKKGPLSPSTLRHDLVVALYCRSQRPLSESSSAAESENLFSLEFCLAGAVKLAGGGKDATLEDRRIGYRACDEIFTEASHPLKLLLINTIREDLHVSSYLPQAEARWTMGLQAASSPRLISPELAPAIMDQVLELFGWRTAPIRRLALAALLRLVPQSSPSLADRARKLVKAALSPPSPGSKQHYPPKATPSEPDARVVSALVAATLTGSPLYPLGDDEAETVNIMLGLLKRCTGPEWAHPELTYHGVSVGWLCEMVLKALAQSLETLTASDSETRKLALDGILEFIDTILEKIDLAFGLLLTATSCLSTLPSTHFQSLQSTYAQVLQRTLTSIRLHLFSKNPNLQFLALKCLVDLPAELWASSTEKGWGEETWNRIMGFLDCRDGTLRAASLRLLQHVDPQLAELRITNLYTNLSTVSESPPTPATQRQRAVLLNLLLETSTVLDTTPSAWLSRLLQIITKAKGTTSHAEVFDLIVLKTVDRYTASSDEARAEFAEGLVDDGTWKDDMTLALLVSATAGGGAMSTAKRWIAASTIGEWMANESGTRPWSFIHPLQEPFLLCLLRLVSCLPNIDIGTLDAQVELASTNSSPSATPLFVLYSRCRQDDDGRAALLAAGKDPQSSTIPGFFAALQSWLARPPLLSRHSTSDNSDVSSLSNPSSPTSRPLRYDSYAAPSSPTQSRSSLGSESRDRGKKKKERERERRERGGKGGMAQSLMTPGALALIVAEQHLEDDDSDTDSNGSRAQIQRSLTPVQRPEASRQREPSLPPSGSPPADLLIELTGAVDPFHSGEVSA